MLPLTEPNSRLPRDTFTRCCLLAALVLLVVAGPLYVCMPVNSDTALFDVQADRILKGGVLYRDIIEPNLPGVVWVHLAIRSLGGWSPEILRMADLLMLAGTLLLLSRLLREQSVGLMFGLAALLFYLSCNEWCHCQRDTWMLLPSAAAMWLRFYRDERTSDSSRSGTLSATRHTALCLLEGVCWGCAFWLKPHVAVPATAVLALSVLLSQNRSTALKDAGWVVLGGVLAAVPGIVQLVSSGAWPHFLDMMLGWNPEYLQAGRDRQSLHRWVLMFRRFYPWWCIHLVAIPVAFHTLQGSLRDLRRADRRQTLIAGLYAGWLIQSLALQHAMDYIHVPAIILGLLLLGGHTWSLPAGFRRICAVGLCTMAILATPAFSPTHLSQWPRCFREGSTPNVRAQLAHGNFPDWVHLAQVTDFLAAQNVTDGDVTCVNVHSVHVFRELRIQPATRYWCTTILQELFPSRAAEIDAAVRNSTHRFIVTEATESGLSDEGQQRDSWPWTLPVVFESGTYRIHDSRAESASDRSHESFTVRSAAARQPWK